MSSTPIPETRNDKPGYDIPSTETINVNIAVDFHFNSFSEVQLLSFSGLKKIKEWPLALKPSSHGMFLHIWQKASIGNLFCSHDMQRTQVLIFPATFTRNFVSSQK